jgi:hypothetical protein
MGREEGPPRARVLDSRREHPAAQAQSAVQLALELALAVRLAVAVWVAVELMVALWSALKLEVAVWAALKLAVAELLLAESVTEAMPARQVPAHHARRRRRRIPGWRVLRERLWDPRPAFHR